MTVEVLEHCKSKLLQATCAMIDIEKQLYDYYQDLMMNIIEHLVNFYRFYQD